MGITERRGRLRRLVCLACVVRPLQRRSCLSPLLHYRMARNGFVSLALHGLVLSPHTLLGDLCPASRSTMPPLTPLRPAEATTLRSAPTIASDRWWMRPPEWRFCRRGACPCTSITCDQRWVLEAAGASFCSACALKWVCAWMDWAKRGWCPRAASAIRAAAAAVCAGALGVSCALGSVTELWDAWGFCFATRLRGTSCDGFHIHTFARFRLHALFQCVQKGRRGMPLRLFCLLCANPSFPVSRTRRPPPAPTPDVCPPVPIPPCLRRMIFAVFLPYGVPIK